MSHKKLLWKYQNMADREMNNIVVQEALKSLLQMIYPAKTPLETKKDLINKKKSDCKQSYDIDYTYEETKNSHSNNNNNTNINTEDIFTQCEPLNLVKLLPTDLTTHERNNRSNDKKAIFKSKIQTKFVMKRVEEEIDIKNYIYTPPTTPEPPQIIDSSTPHQHSLTPTTLPTIIQASPIQLIPTCIEIPNTFKCKEIKRKRELNDISNLIEKNSIIRNSEEFVILGPNLTTMKKFFLEKIDWLKSDSAITRTIVKTLFGRKLLATHTLTGKKSPAFFGIPMPEKGKLDPLIIADLVNFMKLTLNMSEKEVKVVVVSTCSDASKKYKKTGIKGREDGWCEKTKSESFTNV